jgi:hypothetical protein
MAWTEWYEFIKQYTRDEKRQLRQELGTLTDVSNREWPQYYDAETDCLIRIRRTRPNVTTANVDFHEVKAHSRGLLEFASEVAFSSEDIPAHIIPVTL